MKLNFWKKTADAKTVFSLDTRSLALFRMLFGLIIILDMINRFEFVPAFYSDTGILPREMVDLGSFSGMYHFHLMMISGGEWFAYLFLSILLICGILLFIGFKTRLMIFLCWLLFCSVIVRDPLTMHAGDTLLIVLLFWAMFLPLGQTFSIDSLKNPPFEDNNQNPVFSAATIALYIQISLVYIMTGIFKTSSEAWTSGTYLYNVLSRFDYVEPFAFLFYPHYELLEFLTHFTLYLELFGSLLLFIPFFFVFFRMAVIVLFCGLHLFIGLMVDVGLFPLISIAGVLVFIPEQVWENLKPFIKNLVNRVTPELTAKYNYFQKNMFSHTPRTDQKYSGTGIIINMFVSLMIVYVLMLNLSQVTYLFVTLNPPKHPVYFFKLDQYWNMFATPATDSEYLAAEAVFSDGTTTDLMDHLKVNYNSSPDFYHVGYTDYRWRIFFSNNLRHDSWAKYRQPFLEYLIKSSGIENRVSDLQKVELAAYRHEIGGFYDHSRIKRRIIQTKTFE